ncbi:MAG: DUF4249 family protein [Rhodothermales bacterium]|nr:DUF4249 family protein [Rhodothermales bacterium]
MLGCDTVEPEPDVLVVEAFVQPNQPLPTIRASRAVPLDQPYQATPATGAEIVFFLDGRRQAYEPAATPGSYQSVTGMLALPGQSFSLTVRHQGDVATGEGTVPPLLTVDSVHVGVPAAPIRAVLLDSLALPLDTLAVSQTGFIYPIDVTIWWNAPGTTADFWVETSVVPVESFSSRLIDFFLPSTSVLEEPPASLGQRSWTGVYAVPVSGAEDPMPAHRIRAAVVRGSLDYARYALSRNDPERREPISNVNGGIGIITGIALDSLSVHVQ